MHTTQNTLERSEREHWCACNLNGQWFFLSLLAKRESIFHIYRLPMNMHIELRERKKIVGFFPLSLHHLFSYSFHCVFFPLHGTSSQHFIFISPSLVQHRSNATAQRRCTRKSLFILICSIASEPLTTWLSISSFHFVFSVSPLF